MSETEAVARFLLRSAFSIVVDFDFLLGFFGVGDFLVVVASNFSNVWIGADLYDNAGSQNSVKAH